MWLIEQRARAVWLSAVPNKGDRKLLHVITINFCYYDLARSSLRVCLEPAARELFVCSYSRFSHFDLADRTESKRDVTVDGYK